MPVSARFVHVNIVARDYKKLSGFYRNVFGCTPVPPERDLEGGWLDSATGIEDAHIRGEHLRLPGTGDDGPTLEIFQYDEYEEGSKNVNCTGFAHIAFSVDDPISALETVIAEGGGRVGQPVTFDIQGVGTLVFVYARDPEGNILELQKWSLVEK
jgi:predicted enzyme related to lactoylglutathione lyase